MNPHDLPAVLTELPVIGPLFQGSLLWVAIRIGGIVAAFAVGWVVLRRIGRAVADSKGSSTSSLRKQGRFEEAGDLASRNGSHTQALECYERGHCWAKAGHAARRIGEHARAGACFEKAKEHRYAVAAYEAAGDEARGAVAASRSHEPSLKTKAAVWYARSGDPLKAAELYREAGMLADAEKCYLLIPQRGPERAARMYEEAFDKALEPQAASDLAERAVALYLQSGNREQARAFAGRAGIPLGPSSYPAPENPAPKARSTPPAEDLSLAPPLPSLDSFLGAQTAPTERPPPPSSEEKTQTARPHNGTEATKKGVPEDNIPTKRRTNLDGDEVRSRYEIITEIGAGGMGEVFKAKDLRLERIVALKFLTKSLVGDSVAMHFFEREARAAAALNHPTIVTIYDVGTLDEQPFISMEYVEGTDLGQFLKEHGPLPLGFAVNATIHIAMALDYAHERKVVHRDIKPANIMQASDGQMKILDFGLAKAFQQEGHNPSIVAGTPHYMPPEQLAGQKMDGRTDLFSLGVTLYELLTGAMPFDGALRTAAPAPPSDHQPIVPPALDEVILRSMALQADDRYARGRQLANALRKAAPR